MTGDLDDDQVHTDLERVQRRAHTEGAASDQAARLGTRQARKLIAETARRYSLAGIAFCIAISLILSGLVADLYSSQAIADEQARQARQETGIALQNLDDANRTLMARGQPTVPAPAGEDRNAAIAAAVTARVVASLPAAPSAQQVAQVIMPTLAANPTGPAPQELTAAIAAYFGATPPPRGEPGPGPTQAQIDAAVAAAYAANPPAPGKNGTNGRDGDKGDRGERGERGPAGPTCPDGTELTPLMIDDRDVLVCAFPATSGPTSELDPPATTN